MSISSTVSYLYQYQTKHGWDSAAASNGRPTAQLWVDIIVIINRAVLTPSDNTCSYMYYDYDPKPSDNLIRACWSGTILVRYNGLSGKCTTLPTHLGDNSSRCLDAVCISLFQPRNCCFDSFYQLSQVRTTIIISCPALIQYSV